MLPAAALHRLTKNIDLQYFFFFFSRTSSSLPLCYLLLCAEVFHALKDRALSMRPKPTLVLISSRDHKLPPSPPRRVSTFPQRVSSFPQCSRRCAPPTHPPSPRRPKLKIVLQSYRGESELTQSWVTPWHHMLPFSTPGRNQGKSVRRRVFSAKKKCPKQCVLVEAQRREKESVRERETVLKVRELLEWTSITLNYWFTNLSLPLFIIIYIRSSRSSSISSNNKVSLISRPTKISRYRH